MRGTSSVWAVGVLAWIAVVVALALQTTGCSPTATMAATPVSPSAASVRRVVLLPIDLTVLKDGGKYDPAETVADSRIALDVARDALVAELGARGLEVAGELAWSGRIVLPDGRFGAPIVDEAGMARVADGLLAGEALPRDVAVRLMAETDADALVLVSGRGTRLSGDKLAGQIAAASAIGVAAAAITVAIVAVAAAGGKGFGGGGGGGKALGAVGSGGARGLGAAVDVGVRAALLPLRIAAATHGGADVAIYLPGHIHGPRCSPAYGIHDGVAPVPTARPKTGFWTGSRVDLNVTFIGLREGRTIWSANAERHANALKPNHMRSLFHDLLEHGPPA